MKIDLSGSWRLRLDRERMGEWEEWQQPWERWDGDISIPGCLQAQGYGDEIQLDTPWVSGLHDPLWYCREEYAHGAGPKPEVPFLSQPPRHYLGPAWYQRSITLETGGIWTFYCELIRWVSRVWVDGKDCGEDFSLCGAHEIRLGELEAGTHVLTVCVDTTLRYPYRPDGHGVSDALGATWNGMAGEVALLDEEELRIRQEAKKEYAACHPRKAEVVDGQFYIDGRPEYFRGTHIGGEYPQTGVPVTDQAWWMEIMETVKRWGLNFIRCHSFCPPEAAFAAADEAGVYVQVECGMWNHFAPEIPMLDLLQQETRRILRQFGHHPSFVLFSPSNEPGGDWYQVLRQWVADTRKFDEGLGYGGRRLYTAQSGWFYDVAPKDVKGTDYLYFHRSAYGPYNGGNIRNSEGWKGKDYLPSLEGCRLPVICHELGQWCAYPDFSVADSFHGYLQPGNYENFRGLARKRGVEALNKQFAWCSGKNQVMMYKEDLEANFRTPHIYGFELLDLHDYLGQGTAVVGVLDAFWKEKGYVKPEEWRSFCGELVLLARIGSYVVKNTETAEYPVELCWFGRGALEAQTVFWRLKQGEKTVQQGQFDLPETKPGKNIPVGTVCLDFRGFRACAMTRLEVSCGSYENHWDLFVCAKPQETASESGKTAGEKEAVATRSWKEARQALAEGKSVVFSPYLSSLGYECPPTSLKPVFWNGQMGPSWTRGMGMICQEEHPVFHDFPTNGWGGWQWEDILAHARGIDITGFPEQMCHMVRIIDDWNRNTPLSLLFECRMGKGRLLVTGASLEGSFEERPAACCLKEALLSYAASPAFSPAWELKPEQLERLFFPNHQMEQLSPQVVWDPQARVTKPEAALDGRPGTTVWMEKEDYPFSLEYRLKKPETVSGLLYMADQGDRMHRGDIREYRVWGIREGEPEILLAQGAFQSVSLPQKLLFESPQTLSGLRFQILSGFEREGGSYWREEADGWYLREDDRPKAAAFSILSLISPAPALEDDEILQARPAKSRTKEIDD